MFDAVLLNFLLVKLIVKLISLYLQPSQSNKSASADIKSCIMELSAARRELHSKFIIFSYGRLADLSVLILQMVSRRVA